MPRIDREAAPATMVAAAPAALALLLGRPRTAALLGVLPVAVAAFFRDPDRTPDHAIVPADDVLSPAAKAQAAAEVVFLTHNAGLHEVNLGWHPKGEELLWRPDVQEAKRSGNGMENVRYRARWKAVWVQRLLDLIAARAPWLTIRYAF